MSSRSLSQIVILVLLFVGGVSLALRHAARLAEETAIEDSRWLITYDISFDLKGERAEVLLALPAGSDNVAVEREEFSTRGLIERTRRLKSSGTRELVVETNQQGTYPVTAEMTLRLRPRGGWGDSPLTNLAGDIRARYLQAEPTIYPKGSSEVEAQLRVLEATAAPGEPLLQAIFDFCARDLRSAPPNSSASVLGTLDSKEATPLGRARMMVTLCRAAGMPARIVTGFELRQQAEAKPHSWVEVFRDARWRPFDPAYGYARHMPINFVAARKGGDSIIETPGDEGARAESLKASFTVANLGPSPAVLRTNGKRPSQIFDLTRLPVEMHEVLSALLLLPLGALITAFFRNIIGIRTFGTFAPALFAVSFIYADWVTGLGVLVCVLGVGLVGRALVERLRLLMVPRLSIILTIIILCVVFGVSALDYLSLTPSAKAVLLPLVILTILIERFYVTTEEDGPAFAVQLFLGTLFVSAICYFVLSWELVGETILVYPEAHLVTIALFVAIGRYAGYRFVELWRFRELVKGP